MEEGREAERGGKGRGGGGVCVGREEGGGRGKGRCEGGVDVVGVVTPLVRGVAQVLHGDQVVELSVQLEVAEGGRKRRRQGRTGRSRRGESRTQGETHMNMDDK